MTTIQPYNWERWEGFKTSLGVSDPIEVAPPAPDALIAALLRKRASLSPVIVAARQEQDQEPFWEGATSLKLGEVYRQRDLLDDLIGYLQLFGSILPEETHRLYPYLRQMFTQRRLDLK